MDGVTGGWSGLFSFVSGSVGGGRVWVGWTGSALWLLSFFFLLCCRRRRRRYRCRRATVIAGANCIHAPYLAGHPVLMGYFLVIPSVVAGLC